VELHVPQATPPRRRFESPRFATHDLRYGRCVGSDREQELARTATAAASTRTEPGALVSATLGRFRLERELGAGGMGVVHAAFDPDLERRIALKVLRSATAPAEARDRLLREARAMARLSHPNVVTVHEVGTAGGRDFVAMELIHGETLAEWLRAQPRPPAEILDAFLAAGRGLAAAHAAGIVHRDFKPHNVLRSRDGRIVVTDFGLAREAYGALPPALDQTLPTGVTASAASPLVGLTVTGSLLGTPAYMAPEQWQGGPVTPATDQFAFCVALWEALAGQRPYPGPMLDDLRAQVARGPAALDTSRIPRRVRSLLRRGLDPDPARRWPSMKALLVHLVRGQRRPGVALAIAGGALAVAAALVLGLRGGDAPVAPCDPSKPDLAAVWSPGLRADLATKTSDAHVAVLDMASWSWRAARIAACGAPPQVRQAQLACLDGVLARFDALRQAAAAAPGSPAEAIQANLVDPAVCRKPAIADIPRLTLQPTPGVVAALALLGRSEAKPPPSDAELAGPAAASNTDACARVIATLAFNAASQDVARARALMADGVGIADQCGDERLRADLLIEDVPYPAEMPRIGPRGDAALRLAQTAAARVMQSDVAARLASMSLEAAVQRGQWTEAFRLAEVRFEGYRARGLRHRQLNAVVVRNHLRGSRGEPDDLRTLAADVKIWRPIAVAMHEAEIVRRLDVLDALARFQLGDVATAHADLVRLRAPRTGSGGMRITGEVVDRRGRPVAGATVAVASLLVADSAAIGLPSAMAVLDDSQDDLQLATSDPAGRFVIDGVSPSEVMAAQLDDQRSAPRAATDHVKLVLEPTRRITGKVELGAVPYTRVGVGAAPVDNSTGRFQMVGPVAPDGSFSLDGVTVGALQIGAAVQGDGFAQHIELQSVPASAAPVGGIVLRFPQSSRAIDVIVRSAVAAPLDGAQILLVPGKRAIASGADLIHLQESGMQLSSARPAAGEDVPRALRDTVRRDDLVAHIEHVAPGDLTVCAIGIPGDILDPATGKRMLAHLAELTVKCEQIGPTTDVVTVAVPPQPRFDP
jgi:predicted Ser/Thr protein kinase